MTDTTGRFEGVTVRAGTGGGLATTPATGSVGAATHYHAARLSQVGDVVLAVSRVFDPETGAARRLELRAFAASAPGRGALAGFGEARLLDAPGAIAFACLELSRPGDAADERRSATLQRCVVTDAAPTAIAARDVAELLRTTWETELTFGSWPAVVGTLTAFAPLDGGAVADWAVWWLESTEHHVGDAPTAEARPLLKVLSSGWLEPIASGDHDDE